MTSRKKRKHPRARARGLSVHFNGPGGTQTCRGEDISLGGLFMATEHELLPGTGLSLTLLKPGMKKGLQLPAVVANLRSGGPGRTGGLGMRFEGLPANTRSRLLVLLVEMGLANPLQAEIDSPIATPASTMPYATEPTHVRPTPPPVPTRGRPTEISFAPFGGGAGQNTEVMSRADVDRHLAQTLGGDWGESTHHPTPPPAPLSSIPAAPYVPPVAAAPAAGGDLLNDKLQMQIRGLLLQLGEAEQKIATQDQELMMLRERVAELSAIIRKKESELAQVRRESLR